MSNTTPYSNTRQRWAWAFYDWANSAFVMTVMVVFFPIFFRDYWAKGLPSEEITLNLGIATSGASLLVMLMAPFLGALADQGNLKRRLLIGFATLGMLATSGLYWLAEGQWQLAMLVYVLGAIGFLGGNIFYDSLLVDVASEKELNRTSALGYSLGYLGGGLLFALCVWMTLQPELFGLASKTDAVKVSFLLTALWWALFAIPLWLWVGKQPQNAVPPTRALPLGQLFRNALAELRDTFRHIRQQRVVWLFLLAYWFYIDGVDTVAFMAVDFGKTMGFDTSSLITALLITQFVSFPAALAFGWIGNWLGAKNGILLALGGYVLIIVGATFMQDVDDFYKLALSVGLVQGGVQALSRSLYASLIPPERAAEFFGFYNMLGKFAAVLGPLLVGWVGLMTGSPRMGLLAILLLIGLGGLLLWLMPSSKQPNRAGQ
ncbi:MAG TPA: MFS transporter [Candidatus Thiothrix moscowensis]|uniref:MFS transporter n=1 Tax=unclassified Thiothrix TaxID=2636184 RepID=UPI001A225F1B|nr:MULTISPECIES: MFS transporter [unclassified Thiothrix]MBJ6610828.1 MFS transporter [Candidatus Thiothrix moscowensis]HRJ53772.1 MFS transporter [Candidatus Thiothrix moscowensis]HRJ93854.1 MFS transporter [Candidatus Thiothrix moscowensis]